jgi:hypothetical protein
MAAGKRRGKPPSVCPCVDLKGKKMKEIYKNIKNTYNILIHKIILPFSILLSFQTLYNTPHILAKI